MRAPALFPKRIGCAPPPYTLTEAGRTLYARAGELFGVERAAAETMASAMLTAADAFAGAWHARRIPRRELENLFSQFLICGIRGALASNRRRAVLMGLLSYSFVTVTLLADLGLPWHFWQLGVQAPKHSAMFEVSWCVGLYVTVLAFALAASFATIGIFALVPALSVSRLHVEASLRQGARAGQGDRGRQRLRRALAVAQLALAFDALRHGGAAPAVLNAANEIAVAAFLERRLAFIEIPAVVRETLDRLAGAPSATLADILHADTLARDAAARAVGLGARS